MQGKVGGKVHPLPCNHHNRLRAANHLTAPANQNFSNSILIKQPEELPPTLLWASQPCTHWKLPAGDKLIAPCMHFQHKPSKLCCTWLCRWGGTPCLFWWKGSSAERTLDEARDLKDAGRSNMGSKMSNTGTDHQTAENTAGEQKLHLLTSSNVPEKYHQFHVESPDSLGAFSIWMLFWAAMHLLPQHAVQG